VSPVLDALAARQVDGIIWAASQIGDNLAWVTPERLAHLPPTVFLAKPGPGVTTVTVDNFGGAIQATQHLLAQGRRKIGLISGPLAYRAARERHAGWRQALVEAGLDPDPSLVVEGDWLSPSGARGAQELLQRHPDLDAVFACNDDMALGVLGVAHATGRRVPADLAVVGFDNTPTSAHFWPPLTTIHTHVVDAGRLAVRELHSMIEAKQAGQGSSEAATRSLTTELVVRMSSVTR
jgi:LacI family transcriptional regulator